MENKNKIIIGSVSMLVIIAIVVIVLLYKKKTSVPPPAPPVPMVTPSSSPAVIIKAEPFIASKPQDPVPVVDIVNQATTAAIASDNSTKTTTNANNTVISTIVLGTSLNKVSDDAAVVLSVAETPAQIAAAKQLIADTNNAMDLLSKTTALAQTTLIQSINTNFSIVTANVATQLLTLDIIKSYKEEFDNVIIDYNNDANSIYLTIPSAVTGYANMINNAVDSLNIIVNSKSVINGKINEYVPDSYTNLSKMSDSTLIKRSMDVELENATNYSNYILRPNLTDPFDIEDALRRMPPQLDNPCDIITNLMLKDLNSAMVLINSYPGIYKNLMEIITTALSGISASLTTANGTVSAAPTDLSVQTGSTGQLNDAIAKSISAIAVNTNINSFISSLVTTNITIQDAVNALKLIPPANLATASISQTQLANALSDSASYLASAKNIQTTVNNKLTNYQVYSLVQLKSSIDTMFETYSKYNKLNTSNNPGSIPSIVKQIADNNNSITNTMGTLSKNYNSAVKINETCYHR